MSEKQITLDLTSFLDSSQAKGLSASPEAARKIVKAFVSICYEELGKKPNLLDGHDVHHALGHLLPGRLKKKDPLADSVPEVLEAYFAHLEEAAVVTNLFEIRQSLAATMGEFLETVRTGHNAHHGHHHEAQKPIVHNAPKLGRNDPCSCGSGKKYKKCHGKNA